MFIEIILSVVSVIGIYYLGKYLKYIHRYYSLLFKFPKPKWIPIIGHLPEIICEDAIFFKKIRQWNKEYGPAFLASGFYLATVNISGAHEVEAVTSSMKHLVKGRLYFLLHNWLGRGLLTSSGTLWQSRRKILTPAFHFSILREFVNVFNEETETLVAILKQKVGTTVNVIPLISQCTLGAIAETAMGCKLDLQKETDNSYVQAIHKIGKIFLYRLVRAWTFPPFIYCFLPVRRREIALLKTINSFTNKIIRNREKTFEKIDEIPSDETEKDNVYFGKKKLAMLDLLLNAKLTNGSIDDEGIKDEVNTILFEGHDTTAMAISFMLMLLACHRKQQDLVYEEIIENVQENKKHFDLKTLNDLKYMECVIKESLRLFPSVPFIARTLDEDVITEAGLTIPESGEAYLHIYDLHRNPKYWPEPEKFDPDRFLPENCVNRHPFAYIPFSAGPRNCIGQKFAMLEIKAVLTGILKNFILEPVDTPETIVLVPDLVLRPKNSTLLVKFVNRI